MPHRVMFEKDPTIKRQKHRIECTVSFDPAHVQNAEAQALQRLGSQISMKGFRAGKVPTDMLREKVDASALLEETIRVLLPTTFEQLTTANNLQPVIPPHVEAVSRDPLQLKIVFVEKPEVTFKGIDKVKVPKKDHKVEDKDVNQMVDFLLEKHQTSAPVDRPAQNGDRVVMDFTASNEQGEPIPEVQGADYAAMLGSKTLIPGFEDALVGMKVGDKKSVPLTFPEKTPDENLRGKPVTFAVTVKRVEEVRKPELTDEFAKTTLHAESAQAFRENVRNMMIRQEEQVDTQRREQELLDAIRKATVVDLGPELIAQETRSLAHDMEHDLQERGVKIDEWIKQQNKTPEQFEADIKKQAEDRLALRLGIQQLIIDRNLAPTDEELAKEISTMLESMPEDRRKTASQEYVPGKEAYEQMKWQKSVQRLIDGFLAA